MALMKTTRLIRSPRTLLLNWFMRAAMRRVNITADDPDLVVGRSLLAHKRTMLDAGKMNEALSGTRLQRAELTKAWADDFPRAAKRGRRRQTGRRIIGDDTRSTRTIGDHQIKGYFVPCSYLQPTRRLDQLSLLPGNTITWSSKFAFLMRV